MFSSSKNELIEMIAERIENEGVHCDLNDIDVSRIKICQGYSTR